MAPTTTTDLARQRVRNAATNPKGLLFFARAMCGFTDVCIDPHQRLCDFLWGFPLDESQLMPGAIYLLQRNRGRILFDMGEEAIKHFPLHPRLIGARRFIGWPRDTFKSSLGGIAFASQCICRNRDVTILYVSRVAEKAAKFTDGIRKVLRSSRVSHIFGEFYNPENWSREHFTVTGRDPKILDATVSVGGPGVGEVSGHCDLLIADDLYDHENSQTEQGRQQVLGYFERLLSVLNPGGMILCLGTRWDTSDFAHTMMTDPRQSGTWDFLLENEAEWDRPWMDPNARAKRLFFPSRLTEAVLKQKQRDMTTFMYTCQYRLNPCISEKTQLTEAMLRRVPRADMPRALNIVIAIDPADVDPNRDAKVKRRRCYTGMVAVGIDSQANRYVLYFDKRQVHMDDLATWLGEVYRTMHRPEEGWHVRSVNIEKVAFSGLLQPALEVRLPWLKRQCYFDLVKRPPRQHKEERIRNALDWFAHVDGRGVQRLRVAYTIEEPSALDHDALAFPDLLADTELDGLDALEIGLTSAQLLPPVADGAEAAAALSDPRGEYFGALDAGRLPSRVVGDALEAQLADVSPIGVEAVAGAEPHIARLGRGRVSQPVAGPYTTEELAAAYFN